MSGLITNKKIFDETNLDIELSVILDLADCDLFSCGTTVTAATGSNTLSLLESVDGINFVPVAALIITAPGTTIWHVNPVFSQFKKILFTPGSGAASFTVTLNIHTHTIQTAGAGLSNVIYGVS